MSDAAGLFRAILANPDDDLIRLHWADVIERTDPERAEFVRVQVELAKHPCARLPDGQVHLVHPKCYGCEAVAALRRRERELLTPWNFWKWVELPGWPGSPDAQVKDGRDVCITYAQPGDDRQWYLSFSRGFPCRLTLSWSDWQQHAAELLAACPIRRVDRAPRRKCLACNQWCQAKCEWCKGVGSYPAPTADWRGDGVVRLTTWPERGKWLTGIDPRLTNSPRSTSEGTLRVLESRWPGVRFELPRADIRAEAQRQVQQAVDALRRQGYDVGPASPVEVVP